MSSQKTKNIYLFPLPQNLKVRTIVYDNEAHQGSFAGAMDITADLGTDVLAPLDGKILRVIDSHNKYGGGGQEISPNLQT